MFFPGSLARLYSAATQYSIIATSHVSAFEFLSVRSPPGHRRSHCAQAHGGIAPPHSPSLSGSFGVGLVSSPPEHRRRSVRTNSLRIAFRSPVSVDAGFAIIQDATRVLAPGEVGSRRYGEEV